MESILFSFLTHHWLILTMSYHDGENIACKVCGCATQNASFRTDTLDIDNIHDMYEGGNQAAHIAARLNHVDCFKILIQNDARMGKKNFAGESLLTSIIHCSLKQRANEEIHFSVIKG